MSSRILRRDGTQSAEAMRFRPVGGTPATTPLAWHEAQRTKGTRSENSDDEMQELLGAAREQGRSEGQALAKRQAAQHLEPVLTSLSQVAQNLASQRERVRAEAEEDAVKLAIAIGRRVLHREMMTDPEAILGLVKAAFSKLNAREVHRIRVSPDDASTIEKHRAALNLPSGLEIASDRTFARGSALFETERGELDASVDTQLAEIGRGLTDLLRRRNS